MCIWSIDQSTWYQAGSHDACMHVFVMGNSNRDGLYFLMSHDIPYSHKLLEGFNFLKSGINPVLTNEFSWFAEKFCKKTSFEN